MVLSALTLLSVMALTAGAVYQSVPVGHSVTLNCSGSAAGLRGIPEDQLHIEWKRSGDLVFNLISGSPFPGPEFKHRAAVSREKISQENFSVTISPTRFSDEGHYECFCGKGQEQLTFLGEVYLVITAFSDVLTLQCGNTLSLPLLTGEPVGVLFENSTLVCSVQNSTASCVPQYRDRVSVQNSSLTLRSLTPADQGSYTVRDLQGNTISTITLTVEAHRDTVIWQPGICLSLPLFTRERVEVLFDPAGGENWTSVCSVQSGTASCVPQYRDRVSVWNGSLILRSLTPPDQGNYTVRDLQRNTISTVTLTMGDEELGKMKQQDQHISRRRRAVGDKCTPVNDPSHHWSPVGVITGVTGAAGVILVILGVRVWLRRSRTTIKNDYELTRRDDPQNDSSSAISPLADQHVEPGSQNGVSPQVPGVQVTVETEYGHNGHRLQG